MNEMTHVEVTSLLLLINTLCTASQGRYGYLTTKTPERNNSHDTVSWINSHFGQHMDKFSSYKFIFLRSKLGCKANQCKTKISTASQQKIKTGRLHCSMLKINLVYVSVILYMLKCKHRRMCVKPFVRKGSCICHNK